LPLRRSSHGRAVGVGQPVVASVTKTMTSASAIAALHVPAIPAFIGSSLSGSKPPVSMSV
jgi:hypothetical protein